MPRIPTLEKNEQASTRPVRARTPPNTEQDLAVVEAHSGDANALRQIAEKLVAHKHELMGALDETRKRHNELRLELDALCEAEHYPVVITAVERNGSCTAEVYTAGMTRLHVQLHPDIDPARVKIGVRARLAKARNCLLEVSDQMADWRDVATFESYLGAGKALVKYQEQLSCVTLAESLRSVELKRGDLIGFDRDGSGLAFARLDSPDRDHWFTEDFPEDDFAGLAGLDSQILKIKRALDFNLLHKAVAERYGLRSQCGILLYGPPGNGKTRLGRCAASYISNLMPGTRCRFMAVLGSNDYSMWLGQSEARIHDRFEAARDAARQGPVLMFFDEFDALARRRGSDYGSSAPDRILNTLLGELDGIQQRAGITVMAATNRADALDNGAIRDCRFDLRIHVPAPNRQAARGILTRYLKGRAPLAARDADGGVGPLIDAQLSALYSPKGAYSELAIVRFNDGSRVPVPARALVSGALLQNVVQIACEEAAYREVETGAVGVTEEDLAQAIDRQVRSIAQLLTPGNVRSYVSTLRQDGQVVAVEVLRRDPNPGAYVR